MADWEFEITDKPAVLTDEQKAALAEAAERTEIFKKQIDLLQRAADAAERSLLEAVAAGIPVGVLADRLGLSFEALERVMLGKQHLLPQLT